jgi:hypothetical protein
MRDGREQVNAKRWSNRIPGPWPPGPAKIMETPGHVGNSLIDIEAEGIEGRYLFGERTREAKVMGVYGSAQVALAAAYKILHKYPLGEADGSFFPCFAMPPALQYRELPVSQAGFQIGR